MSLTSSDRLKRELITSLQKGLPETEKKIIEEIFLTIDQLDSAGGDFNGGFVSSTRLNELQQRIVSILNDTGYTERSEIFIRDLGKITLNSVLRLNENGFDFQQLPLSEMELNWQARTAESLLGSGVNEQFIIPIIKVVNDSVSFGASVSETRKTLKEFVDGGKDESGKLKSYLTVTSRDAVSQLQGQQVNSVAVAVGYDWVQYTGGIIDHTRGQCYHWVEDLNGKIPREQVKAEIEEAYKKQKEKAYIEAEGFDGELVKHRYSGMMPDTTEENFMIKRGGFGCLHSAFPRKDRKKRLDTPPTLLPNQ